MSSCYGVYIHIPFCKAKCKYCAFVSTPDFSLQNSYVSALLNEIKLCPECGAHVDTVYIGGGTPSCLYGGAVSDILNAVQSTFVIEKNAEITVECNPESVTESFADECASNGVNRISMGLQSASDDILCNIGRIHDKAKFIAATELLSKYFKNISSDIILGLPNQKKDDVKEAVDIVAERCSHASVYALTVEENTPMYDSGYMPDDDYLAYLYEYACKLLRCNGFERYEVSNFARDGKQSRHNNKYWACEPYAGFGVAAHGYDGNKIRYRHSNDIKNYISMPMREDVYLSEKDKYNEYVMLRLRTEKGINLAAFKERFGYDFIERSLKATEKMRNEKYIIVDDGNLRIASEFMFVMNGIIEEFMLD